MTPFSSRTAGVRPLRTGDSSPSHERRLLGWFSLLLGLLLCGLIVIRGQQAARDGNRELQTDTYWVLVSPAVFSIMGVFLLRSSRRRHPGGSGPRMTYGAGASMPAEVSPALAAAQAGVERSSRDSQQALAEVEKAQREAERQLLLARSEATAARAAAQTSEQELQRRSAEARSAMARLEEQLHQAREQRERAEQQVLALQAASRSQEHPAPPEGALQQAGPADLPSAEEAWRRTEELVGTLSRELSEARSLLTTLSREEPAALTAAHHQASAALEAARTACREAEALKEHHAQQLEQVQRLLERCTTAEQGELAQLRGDVDQALTQARAAHSASAELAAEAATRLTTLDQTIQQAQQASLTVASDLGQALQAADQSRADAAIRAEATERRVDELASRVSAELQQARDQGLAARQSSLEARQLLERLEQVVFAVPAAAQAPSGPSQPGADSSGSAVADLAYREACGELGVLPGSSWQQVRAAWRRNLLQWHPDQGGDSRLWSRRQAAYQLLEAWYAFQGSS